MAKKEEKVVETTNPVYTPSDDAIRDKIERWLSEGYDEIHLKVARSRETRYFKDKYGRNPGEEELKEIVDIKRENNILRFELEKALKSLRWYKWKGLSDETRKAIKVCYKMLMGKEPTQGERDNFKVEFDEKSREFRWSDNGKCENIWFLSD